MMQTETILFDLDGEWMGQFLPLLRRGFTWPYQPGQSLRSVLIEAGIPQEYIEERLQTIFLNGSPADSLDMPVYGAQVRLALSTAMPGILGATMRRGGYYASMRDSISSRAMTREEAASSGSQAEAQGWLTIRLLNFTASEAGPFFLRRGVGLETEDVMDIVTGLPEAFWHSCRQVQAAGTSLEPSREPVIRWLQNKGQVWLRIIDQSGKPGQESSQGKDQA